MADAPDLVHDRDAAWALLTEWTKAEALLKQAADKLLANTVVENYRVEVVG